MRIALCGNPNVGKTTLYNRLTRSNAPVGNWHGVTVDARGKRAKGGAHTVVDLPGAYSLTARSAEEGVTRDETLFGGYDVIAYVAEVNNLRRNLYMLTQLAEAGKKCILIVNMMDEARGKVDLGLISSRLGIPVVGTSEKRRDPTAEIFAAAEKARVPRIDYLSDGGISRLAAELKNADKSGLTAGFAAAKLIERDGYIAEKLGCDAAGCAACGGCNVGGASADRPAMLRYAFIDRALDGAIERVDAYKKTDAIDRVALGKLALPIFFLIMTAVFVITFEAAKPLSDLLSRLIATAAERTRGGLGKAPEWVGSLVSDGVIGGVGAVLAFLPQVVILFLLTALLQDSGYMSRVAFVTDGFFKKLGLGGRAAFSVILGLGCSVTAVLSARGIADASARRRAAFVAPFVPCSARLAVFTAITAYFGLGGLTVAAMYVCGFIAAVVVLKISSAFVKTDAAEKTILEIPPYRLPSPSRVARSVWSSVSSFVVRVGSVILCVGVIMWVLSNFSVADGFTGGGENSLMCTLASLVAPMFRPLGFGNWRAVTALLSGIAAKETVVSVIATLGGLGEVFASRHAAVSFLIFTCLYVPCIATLGALAKENGAKSALLSALVHTLSAYLCSYLYYSAAVLIRTDTAATAAVWSCLAAAVATAAAVLTVKTKKKRRKPQAA